LTEGSGHITINDNQRTAKQIHHSRKWMSKKQKITLPEKPGNKTQEAKKL